jgi:hypothetical protein
MFVYFSCSFYLDKNAFYIKDFRNRDTEILEDSRRTLQNIFFNMKMTDQNKNLHNISLRMKYPGEGKNLKDLQLIKSMFPTDRPNAQVRNSMFDQGPNAIACGVSCSWSRRWSGRPNRR